MNWACEMIEPSVRTLLIRLYYTDLSSRMGPGHHRSYVINDPLSFEFQSLLLLVRGLALLSCFGAYFNFWAKNENLILVFRHGFFFVQSRAWRQGEELLSYNLRLRDKNKNNKNELVTMVLFQTEELSPNLFCLNIFFHIREANSSNTAGPRLKMCHQVIQLFLKADA